MLYFYIVLYLAIGYHIGSTNIMLNKGELSIKPIDIVPVMFNVVFWPITCFVSLLVAIVLSIIILIRLFKEANLWL